MTYNLKFKKYDACGNDLILIDELTQKPVPENLKGKVAKLISDRKNSIGSDGALYVTRSRKADFAMRMFNPDGTEDMCGNGLRCVALYAFEYLTKKKKKLLIDTVAGTKEAVYLPNGTVVLNMGQPVLDHKLLPIKKSTVNYFDKNSRYVSSCIKIEKKQMKFVFTSMGTPHAVFVTNKDTIEKYFSYSGKMEKNNIFSERVNIDWVEIIDKNNVSVRIWERGVGETLSCGTGACSVATVVMLLGLANEKVNVHFKGGVISIAWKGIGHDLFMSGNAKTVQSKEVKINSKMLQNYYL